MASENNAALVMALLVGAVDHLQVGGTPCRVHQSGTQDIELPLSGVIGVIGPTRMPYDKVIALVGHTSRLVSDLLC